MSIILRNLCFTINNYKENAITNMVEAFGENLRYIIVAKEIAPKTGTPHLQGYLELKKRIRQSTVLKCMQKGAHIEKRKGTAKQAADYCRKSDENAYEWGTMSNQGSRSDLYELFKLVKNGFSNADIAETLPPTYIRYYRAVDRLRADMIQCPGKAVVTEVIVGPAGCGKTRKVYEKYPDVYFVDNYPWFDGYIGQDVILFDDFYGGIPYHKLLRLLDRYPMQLAIKGGFTKKAWTKVFFTSNKPPEEWYEKGLTPALKRRLGDLQHLESPGVTEVGGNTNPNFLEKS